MKSVIPAIIAVINELIEKRYEVELGELQTRQEKLKDDYDEAAAALDHRAAKIRTKLKRLHITSSELSDLRDGLED